MVKSRIVQKYFSAWAKVVLPSAKPRDGKIAYIDLFAGPGRYQDESASTPVLVLEQAVNDADLRDSLVSIFNDINQNHSNALQIAIDRIAGIDRLKYKPAIHNLEVDDQIAESFEKLRLVPTFFFIDPWGFKGLSLRLVHSVLKDWGCDCIFFFNFNSINMGLTNHLVRRHMDDLFGEQQAQE